jgi:hypothetical protein
MDEPVRATRDQRLPWIVGDAGMREMRKAPYTLGHSVWCEFDVLDHRLLVLTRCRHQPRLAFVVTAYAYSKYNVVGLTEFQAPRNSKPQERYAVAKVRRAVRLAPEHRLDFDYAVTWIRAITEMRPIDAGISHEGDEPGGHELLAQNPIPSELVPGFT